MNDAYPLTTCLGNMTKRCHDPQNARYADYGGRGISVCDEWRANPQAFKTWALANGWKPGLQIDRIDNDGDYTPSNCRWVTRRENALNRRNTARITAFGVTKRLDEWKMDERCRCSIACFTTRIHRGWESELAISTPAHRPAPKQVVCHVCGRGFRRRKASTVCCSTGCGRKLAFYHRWGRWAEEVEAACHE